MKREIHGFLFGHFDSRGGCTFVEAANEATALAKYSEAFKYWNDADPDAASNAAELLANLKDDDLLGPAIIETELEIVDGQELDGGFSGTLELDAPDDIPRPGGITAYLDDIELGSDNLLDVLDHLPDGPVRIFYGPFPGPGFVAPRWDDDAFGLIFTKA